jgi:hypothetical protein
MCKDGAKENMAAEEMRSLKRSQVLCIGTIRKMLQGLLGIPQTPPITFQESKSVNVFERLSLEKREPQRGPAHTRLPREEFPCIYQSSRHSEATAAIQPLLELVGDLGVIHVMLVLQPCRTYGVMEENTGGQAMYGRVRIL